MRTTLTAIIGTALVALLTLSHSTAFAQQRTAKQCSDEWAANRTALEASGQTRRAFIADCRGVALTSRAAPTRSALGKGEYATEADAKASCGADAIVWINPKSRIYHAGGSKSYGKTQRGAYMCEKESVAAGFRASKSVTGSASKSARPPAT